MMYPTAWIDSNEWGNVGPHDGPWRPDDIYVLRRHVSIGHLDVGDPVLLVDTGDGEDKPFATWGSVIEQTSDDLFVLRRVGDTPHDNGFVYVR